MQNSRPPPHALPTDDPEVRSYVKRLLTAILFGLIVVVSTAVWAWNEYAGKLKDAPPLPEGTPPLSSVPATTR